MSIHSQSPHSQSMTTPINELFQKDHDDDDYNDNDDQRQTDEQTKAKLEKYSKGKWDNSLDKDNGIATLLSTCAPFQAIDG